MQHVPDGKEAFVNGELRDARHQLRIVTDEARGRPFQALLIPRHNLEPDGGQPEFAACRPEQGQAGEVMRGQPFDAATNAQRISYLIALQFFAKAVESCDELRH